jgi:hypothetical protein
MASKFNSTFNTLITEANLRNRVLGIVKEYCRKGVEGISLYNFVNAWTADKKLNFDDINDAVCSIAMDQVKNLSGIPVTQTSEPEENEFEEDGEIEIDGEPSEVGNDEINMAPELSVNGTSEVPAIDTKQIVVDAIQEYIEKKLEKTLSLKSYLNSFMNEYNSANIGTILGYDQLWKALYELVLDFCHSQLNEKKEEGLKVTQEEVEQAFKDYTGQRIPGGEGDDCKIEDFDMEQLMKGIMMEFEHTNDVNFALEIVVDHLTEHPKYYDYLEAMETEMDEEGAEENKEEKEAETIKEETEIVFPSDLVAKSKIFDVLKSSTSKIPTLCDHTIKVLAIEIYNILEKIDEPNARMNRISVLLTKHNYVMNTELTVLYGYILKALGLV